MTRAIVVPADGPLFEGHFPGRPILPGISLLALVANALSPATDRCDVSAIPFVRFRGLVLPGDHLELDANERGQGGFRFEARRAGEVVANGALVFGVPQGGVPAAIAMAARAPRGTAPIAELIPHRPPMLFVERFLGEADDGATCLGRIPAASALVIQGSAPSLVALEVAAQTAAVWESVRRSLDSGKPEAKTGYLVSLRDVVLHRTTVPADAELIASIRLVATAPPLTTYAVAVSLFGELAVTGTIGTYLNA
jgi:3-hydroxyacyl-[acyl-carrier-protein] dehydratase